MLLALMLPSIAIADQKYMLLPIVSIYDGDTIKSKLSLRRLPSPLNLVSIRVNHIDTPEYPAASYLTTGKLGRAKCTKEADLALKSKMLVEQIAANSRYMKIENYKWGKFGGRILGDVIIGGQDIGTALLDAGLAVPYDGKKKTHDWCL